MTIVDESEAESGMMAVDDLAEHRKRQREERRRLRREQREKGKEEEGQQQKTKNGQEAEQETPKEDPLTEYLNKMMDNLEELFQKSEFSNLKTKAESFLLTMEKYDKNVTEHKMAYVGKAHSYLGNAYVGLKHFEFAMMHHDKDLEIGQRWKLTDCVSRALGNIGRVYISRKKYDQALKFLAQKTKIPSNPRETAWLYHEIASCFLQLHHYQFAKDAATKSLEAAADTNDSLYQLQTNVLLGAIQVKLQKFEKAYGTFERALDQARIRDDKKAQQAIAEALREVNERIAREARRKQIQQETSRHPPLATSIPEVDKKEADKDKDDGTNNSVSETARDTGEDPELTGLVDDDTASEATRDGKEKKDEANTENQNEAKVEEDEKDFDKGIQKETATVEEGDKKAEAEKTVEKDVKSNANEAETKDKEHEEDPKDKDKDLTVKDGYKKNEEEGEKTEETGDEKETSSVDTGTKDQRDDGAGEGQQGEKGAITTAGDATDAMQGNETYQVTAATHPVGNAGKEENVTKGDAQTVAKTDGVAELASDQSSEKEEKDKEKDEANKADDRTSHGREEREGDEQDGDKEGVTVVVTGSDDTTGGKSVGSPDATYRAEPITQELLTKNMAKDRGMRESMRKSVISMHDSVQESESRRSSATSQGKGRIEASTKKSVTIGGTEEMAGNEKEKAKAEEKKAAEEGKEEPEEPQEPRGKDPIADRMEDDLTQMEKDYTDKNFDQLLKRGNDLMKALKKVRNIDNWSKRRLRNFAKVHSFMGSTSSEKQNFDKARMHHNADLKIGEVLGNTKIQSRALEHLGRTFIFENKHEKALEFFAKRAHLPRTSEETARLFHEIANCFFQLKAYEFAKDSAMVSMKAANEGHHTMFQLQSAVLIGVTKVKLQRTDAAFETFEEALKFATIRDDHQAAEAIRQAMRQIEAKVAMNVKDKWMKKVKDSKGGQLEEGSEAEKLSQISEGDSQSRAGAESASTVCGILSSMKEEEESTTDAEGANVPDTIREEGEAKKGAADTAAGGSETTRMDKDGFLLAPEGPMDKKEPGGERTVKREKETVSHATTKQTKKQGAKKLQKKTATETVIGAEKDKIKSKGKATTNATGKKDEKPKTTAPNKTKTNNTNNNNVKVNAMSTNARNKQDTKSTRSESQRAEKDANDSTSDKSKKSNSNVIKSEQVGVETVASIMETDQATDVSAPNAHDQVAKSNGNAGDEDDKGEDHEPVAKGEEAASKETADTDKAGTDHARQDAENTTDEAHESEKSQADEKHSNANEDKKELGQVDKEEPDKGEPKAKVNDGKEPKQVVNEENQKPSTDATEKEENAEMVTADGIPIVAPKPSPRKAKPKVQNNEEESKPPMERRKSERFVGLDPKKVAEYKIKTPRSISEEEQEKLQISPKPKTERFVGLKVKKEKTDDTQTGHNMTDKKSYQAGKEDHVSGKVKQAVKTDKESKGQQNNEASRSLTAPRIQVVENSPSPQKAMKLSNTKTNPSDSTIPNDDDGYETNVPNLPILTINDEVGFVRHDSIASKLSAPRPATRMSLADMVKDDLPVSHTQQPKDTKNSSKEELSALNAMVKEAIKRDKNDFKKAQEETTLISKDNPRKSIVRFKSNSVNSVNDFRMEEMRREAEIKRARRKRFLRNYKASFLLMLNSPYAEVHTTQGRRMSTDFNKQFRRNMSKANLNLAIHEEGTYYQSFEEQERSCAYKTSPRKSNSDKSNISPEKLAAKRRALRRKTIDDEDEILDHIEEQLAHQDEDKPQVKDKNTSEETRIAAGLAKAARDMRRSERDGRREERRRLEESERQRRIDDREQKDLLAAMATKVTFSNPYDKSPRQIPGLGPRNSLGGGEEKWMASHERKLLRAKRRERREKELKRRHEEEKNNKKRLEGASKRKSVSKTGSKEASPRLSVEEDKDDVDSTPLGMEDTPEETLEVVSPKEGQAMASESPDVSEEEDEVDSETEEEEQHEEEEEIVEPKVVAVQTPTADMAEMEETKEEERHEMAVAEKEEKKETETHEMSTMKKEVKKEEETQKMVVTQEEKKEEDTHNIAVTKKEEKKEEETHKMASTKKEEKKEEETHKMAPTKEEKKEQETHKMAATKKEEKKDDETIVVAAVTAEEKNEQKTQKVPSKKKKKKEMKEEKSPKATIKKTEQKKEVMEEKKTEEKKEKEPPMVEEKKTDEEEKKEHETVTKAQETAKPDEEEENEEEDTENDDFDGYNDSEEDDDDLVAVYIEKEVRQMRKDYNVEKIQEVVTRGNALLKALKKHTDIVSWSRRRLRWFAAAHSYMGSANMDIKEFHKAQSHHQADFRIGEALEDTKVQSRALEHLARVSVLDKNTPKALEYLAKRAHLPRDSEQSARLFHEMANCFFSLGALEYARDAAAESLEASSKGGHSTYMLQSCLLMAVCNSKLKNYDTAEEQFSTALSHARRLNDKNTEEAIRAALKEVEIKRTQAAAKKWKEKVRFADQDNANTEEVDEE